MITGKTKTGKRIVALHGTWKYTPGKAIFPYDTLRWCTIEQHSAARGSDVPTKWWLKREPRLWWLPSQDCDSRKAETVTAGKPRLWRQKSRDCDDWKESRDCDAWKVKTVLTRKSRDCDDDWKVKTVMTEKKAETVTTGNKAETAMTGKPSLRWLKGKPKLSWR